MPENREEIYEGESDKDVPRQVDGRQDDIDEEEEGSDA